MSVCVSSSLSSGMSHVSHLHLTSSLSMMHPFQNYNQMAPSSNILNSGLDLTQAQHSNQQQPHMQNSSSSSSSDGNEPNPEMLLALIARNKTLEGEFYFILSSNFADGKSSTKGKDLSFNLIVIDSAKIRESDKRKYLLSI